MSDSSSKNSTYDETFDEEVFKLVDILKDLDCPLLGREERAWLDELFFQPGPSRMKLLQWIHAKVDPGTKPPHHPPSDSRECANEMVALYNSIGCCRSRDVKLIAGHTSKDIQLNFWNLVLDWCKYNTTRNQANLDVTPSTFLPGWEITREFIRRQKSLFNPESISFPLDLHHYTATEAISSCIPTFDQLLKRKQEMLEQVKCMQEQLRFQEEPSSPEDLRGLAALLRKLQEVIANSKIKDSKPPAVTSPCPELVDPEAIDTSHSRLVLIDQTVESLSTISATLAKIQQLNQQTSSSSSKTELSSNLLTLAQLWDSLKHYQGL